MLPVLALLACSRPTEAPGAVVVVVDTLRADYGGSDYMPLDLSQCRVYTRAHSCAPYTTSSTACIVSGRLPVGSARQRPGATDVWTDESIVGHPTWPDHVLTDQSVVLRMRGASKLEAGHFWDFQPGSPALGAEAVAFLESEPDGDVYVHMTGPHEPHAGSIPGERGDHDNCRSLPAPDRAWCEHRRERDEGAAMPGGLYEWKRWQYTAGVDLSLRQVANIQQASGPSRLFIFTSDHGEALGEDGRWGHMSHLTDEVLRHPLIVCGPGVVPGEDDTPVGSLCIRETVEGTGPCDLRTGEGLRTTPAGMLTESGEWVTRDVGAEWATLVDGGPAG